MLSMLSWPVTPTNKTQVSTVRLACAEAGLVVVQGVELVEVQDVRTGQEGMHAAARRSHLGTGVAPEPGMQIA